MSEDELLELPEPPEAHREVVTSTNAAGQQIYRVITFSRWEVVPNR